MVFGGGEGVAGLRSCRVWIESGEGRFSKALSAVGLIVAASKLRMQSKHALFKEGK